MKRWRAASTLTLAGLAAVGICAGTISGLNAKQKAYTITQLKAHWKAPFDLLVLPKGTSPTVGQVTDPNAINEGSGGISLAQYQEIASLAGVQVAAPLVILGSFGWGVPTALLATSPGIYRVTTVIHNVGLPEPMPVVRYSDNTGLGWSPVFEGLVVAIDPTAEQELVGLKKAVVKGTYFGQAVTSQYNPLIIPPPELGIHESAQPLLANIPVLLDSVSPMNGSQSVTVTALRLPFSLAKGEAALSAFYHSPPSQWASSPLQGLKGSVVFQETLPDSQSWQVLEALSGFGTSPSHLGPFQINTSYEPLSTAFNDALAHYGPVAYRAVTSPFPKRWPVAMVAGALRCTGWCLIGKGGSEEPFRSVTYDKPISIGFTAVGLYDPMKLKVAEDPLTHLPLVNYRPEQGEMVLSPSGKALNPPQVALPGNSAQGLFTDPPTLITDIKDVLPILGQAPISSIRIKVAGGEAFTLESEATLQKVAQDIRQKTGLTVEVVLGASPQQVLIHPQWEPGFTHVGWIQEQWVRLGAGLEILRQTLLSQDVILVPVLVGALVFALTVGVIGVEVRKKEYGVLLAVGVTPQTIQSLIFREGILYGAIVFFVSLASSVVIAGTTALGTGLFVASLGGAVMLVALYPVAKQAAKMDPLTALKETSPRLARVLAPISVLGMGVGLLASSWRRHLASLVALLVPGGVFYIIFMVQAAMNHTFYLTALGQYLLVRVGPMMAFGAIVAVLLAILASAQIGMRNAVVRAHTWAVGQAMGWPRWVPPLSSIVEAGTVGLFAGVIGSTLGALAGDTLFGVTFRADLWATAILVIVVSGIASSVPAVLVLARQEPIAHLRSMGH